MSTTTKKMNFLKSQKLLLSISAAAFLFTLSAKLKNTLSECTIQVNKNHAPIIFQQFGESENIYSWIKIRDGEEGKAKRVEET
ncbi:MAG: hypothetical protein ACOCW1_04030 [Chitinispirillaceae bacterium]